MRAWVGLCFGLITLWPTAGNTASITAFTVKGEPFTRISIKGELKFGDEKLFIEQAIKVEKAVVILESDGGSLIAGLEIGKAIRLKGFATWVPNNVRCASACALAWLAGRPRFMAASGRVGFHAAYRIEDGSAREDGAANAITGAYLHSLNLPQGFIIYATSTPPERVKWLTFEDAVKYGVDARREDGDSVVAPQDRPVAEAPSSQPILAPAPEATTQTSSPQQLSPNPQPAEVKEATAPPPSSFGPPPMTTTVRPSIVKIPLADLTRLDAAVGIQRRLQQLNYFQTSVVDGVWGPRSRIALRDFKAANSLPNTDEWDITTQSSLASETALPAPYWYRAPDPLAPLEGLYRPFLPPPGATWHPFNPREAHIIQRRLQELGYYSLPLRASGAWPVAWPCRSSRLPMD